MPGGTESVDGTARNMLRQSCKQRGHSGHIAIVFTGLIGGTEVDVFDRGRIDTGPVDRLLDCECGQIIRTYAGESACIAAERGSNG